MKLKFENRYLQAGMTAFLTITACIVIFFIIYRYDNFADTVDKVVDIIKPFIYGLVFAYLLCPFYNMVTRSCYRILNHKMKKQKHVLPFSKGIATFFSLLLFFIIIVGVCWMIIPGLIDSVAHIIEILPDSMNHLTEWLESKTGSYPELQVAVESWAIHFTDNIMDYFQEKMLPSYVNLVTSISTGVFSIVGVVSDFFIGIIICAYFLNSKDLFAAQAKKLVLAICREAYAEELLRGAKFTNRTFGGFINGKLIDSAIIGVLCFICMTIFGWEYPLLISCVVGLTNVIPFFGPFIGAIPSALLILMVNPMQCIYFLIFILCLQQLDGNVIGPKILGDSTGLASFWVLFSVLVGGGLFNFAGMVLGIPVFAVFYAYFSRFVNNRLDKKGFSTDIKDYTIDKYRVKPERKREDEGIANEIVTK